MKFRFTLSEAWTYLLGAAILMAWLRWDLQVGAFVVELAAVYALVRALPWKWQVGATLAAVAFAAIPGGYRPNPARLPSLSDLVCMLYSGVRYLVLDFVCMPVRVMSMHVREGLPEWLFDEGREVERLLTWSVALMVCLAAAASALESRRAGRKREEQEFRD